jgi:hypothetical protein
MRNASRALLVVALILFWAPRAELAGIEPVGKLSVEGGAEKEEGSGAGGRVNLGVMGVMPLAGILVCRRVPIMSAAWVADLASAQALCFHGTQERRDFLSLISTALLTRTISSIYVPRSRFTYRKRTSTYSIRIRCPTHKETDTYLSTGASSTVLTISSERSIIFLI